MVIGGDLSVPETKGADIVDKDTVIVPYVPPCAEVMLEELDSIGRHQISVVSLGSWTAGGITQSLPDRLH